MFLKNFPFDLIFEKEKMKTVIFLSFISFLFPISFFIPSIILFNFSLLSVCVNIIPQRGDSRLGNY